MSIKIKKGYAALAAMIFALSAAVFINWYYTSPKTKENINDMKETTVSEKNLGDAQYVAATAADGQNESFADFENQRKTAHAEAKETLEKVIKSPDSSQQAVNNATESLEELSKAIKRENDLETLISAKTGNKCIVIIDSGDIQVITAKGTLNDNITMQIKDIIMKQGDFTPEKFSIFELK